VSNPDIDESSENVLASWPSRSDEPEPEAEEPAEGEVAPWVSSSAAEEEQEAVAEPELEVDEEPELDEEESEPGDEPEETEDDGTALTVEPSTEHAAGELVIPEGYAVLEGVADGGRRAVGVVVSRFNGAVTSRLLAGALEELDNAGVRRDAITVMVVPGAFELPVAATALAKTRRFACIIALGCVIRGDTPHFDYVASEAASGIQLAALETGVPCSFGVLTLDRVDQADARVDKGAEAVRSALEMADVFSHLRAAAAR
jgi:6,7-dimethyl-8-ribityllumazine synthase